ncbi:hypothetical protein DM01DRAFT_93188 [Hesseltinella vesiculosa]|uniref:Uncharacterized protein n=1 Tax=Hesseltinella vesiculosa TaxID=101127 RepID=A0A1X2GMW5_9FUNG|nr:hypothetical protein DM01DRAFT_93188 [Hesseltinella vesiculosa]
MSLYVSSNKPRSLLRQSHYLTSHGPSLPSNVEHSLEQWLQKGECMPSPLFAASSSQPPELWNKSSSSSTSSQSSSSNTSTDDHPSPVTLPAEDLLSVLSPHDAPLPCPCCQQDQCLSWCRTSNIMRKLDAELRLAAEIGQNLLQKNETLTLESSQIKDQLEQAYERRGELEASLNEAEALAQRLNREKDKWLWQYEKSEKILQETIADLETTNYKCAALSQEFEQAKMDLEKLQLFKLKSQQADSRETLLQAKVNDLDQELTIARKNELTLESKYKKLVARYGNSRPFFFFSLCLCSLFYPLKNPSPVRIKIYVMVP